LDLGVCPLVPLSERSGIEGGARIAMAGRGVAMVGEEIPGVMTATFTISEWEWGV